MANEIKTYTTKETAKILGIKERAVQTRCKKDNIRKKSNQYIITDLIIADWKQANAKANANANATEEVARAIAPSVADIQKLNLDEIEDFEFKFRREGEFPKLGNFFFVERGKFIVEHTPEQFEIRKKEYQQAEEEIRLNRFKIKSKDERILFLEKHLETWVGWANGSLDNLRMNLESSSNLSKSIFIESTVKAKNTEWKKGTEPNKKGK